MKYLLILIFSGTIMANPHPDFISLSEYCPGIKIQASYSTRDNFTGEIVRGYKAQKAFLSKTPAFALCEVQKAALEKGLSLKIFDGYRPVKAVQFFQDWAKKPEDNPDLKKLYYPTFTRLELFEKGFIAKQSSHSRGSAIDLTLIDLKTGRDLDMGSGFDFFDVISHTETNLVTENQKNNRMMLKEMMESKGFRNFHQEWWHFSFKPEPHPDQYFDFDVE
jgi:D-alanyl-D-alanine dipeptidase